MRVSDTNQIWVNRLLRARTLRLLILDHILAILQHIHIISTQTNRLRTRLTTTKRRILASRDTAGSTAIVYATTRLHTISIFSTTTVTTETTRTKTSTPSRASNYGRPLWVSLNTTTVTPRTTAHRAYTTRTLRPTVRGNRPHTRHRATNRTSTTRMMMPLP